MRFPRAAGTLLLAATLVAACGDDNGPSDFDAEGMSADIQEATAIFASAPVDDFIALGDHVFDVLGGGIVTVRAPAAGSAALRPLRGVPAAAPGLLARMHPAQLPGGMAAIIVPDELLGTTFEWNTGTDQYEQTARAGAPADGVRFIAYTMSGATPGEPLDEVGYLDVIDQSTGSGDAARVVFVRDGATVADYEVTETVVTGGGSVVMSGYLADEDEQRLEFDLNTSVTNSGANVSLDYLITVPHADLTADYLLEGDDESFDLEFLVEGPNGEIEITGGGNTQQEQYDFFVNGDEFATLTFIGSNPGEIVGADGDPLSPADEEAMGRAYDLTFLGFDLANVLALPIFGGLI